MREHGANNFYIELLEDYPCQNREQLRAKEGEYIRKLSTRNKRIERRTIQEWRKDNEEYLKKNKQTYRQRDDVINRRKLKMICSCGCEVRKEDIRRHERTKKHQNALKNLNNIKNVQLQSDDIRETGETTEGE